MNTFAENAIISIHYVAKAARVSHPTVSRALRNSRLVKPETAARIQKVAREMGYRPSAVARSLVTRRTETIGVVVTNIADPFVAGVVAGIEEVANRHGYSVFLANSNADPEREVKVESLLKILDGTSAKTDIDVEGELIVRDSSAPPRRSGEESEDWFLPIEKRAQERPHHPGGTRAPRAFSGEGVSVGESTVLGAGDPETLCSPPCPRGTDCSRRLGCGPAVELSREVYRVLFSG